jgi:glucokinase
MDEMKPGGTAADPVTVLAGDIGGTNARLAQVRVEVGGRARIVREETYASSAHDGLAEIVRRFMDLVDDDVEGACFAVAGPVVHGRVEATNLPWLLDEADLARDLGIDRVVLINDFAAIGHGIGRLQPDDVVTVKRGLAEPDGTIAVIGPGTGLGHGFVAFADGRRIVLPSEGGHAGFAPADEVEWELLRHLRRRHGHASWERVVSGPGLASVYRFLASRPGATERLDVRAAMEQEDPAAVVTRYALEKADPLCVEALDRVIRALAVQAANFALTVYATGGVFIAGGIAPRVLPLLRDQAFAEAFENKGRFRDFLETVPIHVVTDTQVGLRGAAALAARTEAGSPEE